MIFGILIFVAFGTASMIESIYEHEDGVTAAKKSWGAILVQLFIAGALSSVALSDALTTGDFLSWIALGLGLAVMVAKYIDLHNAMNRIEALEGTVPL